MKNLNLLKQEFLKKWIEGLRACSSSSKAMGCLERKNAIKLSADLAMAFARRGRTSWSRAIIARHRQSKKVSMQRQFRSKNITKRSRNFRRAILRNGSSRRKVGPSFVAKRTQVLKSLVPGGHQCMDEVTLMRETLDYVLSLQAQVDVMRLCLANATGLAKAK